MGNTVVFNQTKQVEQLLSRIVEQITRYLNETTIEQMQAECAGDRHYYEGVLSDLRRLAVYGEEGIDACRIVLQEEPFRKAAAEQALYKIYHSCVAEFFTPKRDLWYEDSRSAYTGRHSIKLRQPAPPSLQQLLHAIEADFQTMREELEFYETDYRTKVIQSQ
ncbi:YpuI family protein [Anoxybacillus kestanbolensis]|uniref:YpuI family protein n=1 Tax=Anoxybacillus kestanbolensis TaxID=227476 RepID=UPI003D24293B